MQSLLESNKSFSFQGGYYKYRDLHVRAAIQNELMPKFCNRTASFDGMSAARQVGDVTLTIPKSLSDFQSSFPAKTNTFNRQIGIKIKLTSKPNADEALKVAKSSQTFRIREVWKKRLESELKYSKIEEKFSFPLRGKLGTLRC